MQERHRNRRMYFEEQGITTSKYVIPFIEPYHHVDESTRVLEIGCGEGGNLAPFLDLGCQVVGVDLNADRMHEAEEFFADHPNREKLQLILLDIYKVDPTDFQFDVIFLRDVIEHIHEQEVFMPLLKRFLKPGGVVFFAFPPWYMPFGGHQQICRGWASKLPFFHLLPKKAYNAVLRWSGETDGTIADLDEIKETGITIERFERILKANAMKTLRRELYFINPNYEVKFHLKPRKALPVLRSIPYLRDFFCTAAYYVVEA